MEGLEVGLDVSCPARSLRTDNYEQQWADFDALASRTLVAEAANAVAAAIAAGSLTPQPAARHELDDR